MEHIRENLEVNAKAIAMRRKMKALVHPIDRAYPA